MRSRLIPILSLGVVAIGLAGVLVSISVGENSVGGTGVGGVDAEAAALEGIGEVQELVGGLRQLDSRLGDEDAPVTLNLFTDIQCERCADYQLEVVEPLIRDYVRTGEAKFEYRNFPLGLKPVTLGGIATEAASEQARGWQYLSLFMRNLDRVPERGVTEEFLDLIAAGTPKLDTAQWESDLTAPDSRERAETDVELATELRLPADPAIVVDGPTGSEQLEGAPALGEVEAAIERVR